MDQEKELRQQKSEQAFSLKMDEALGDNKLGEDVPQEPSTGGKLLCPLRYPPDYSSCPFRKRDPERFNLRYYPECSLSGFSSMSLLIKHVKCYHQIPELGCPSYLNSFGTEESRDEDSVSEISSFDEDEPLQDSHLVDQEDGVAPKTVQELGARAQPRGVAWKSLWTLLFPDDTEYPSHEFEAPIEINEFQQLFYNQRKLRELGIRSQRYMQSSSTQLASAVVFYFCQMYIIETLHQCRSQRGHRYSAVRVRREEECLLSVKHIISRRTVQKTEYSEASSSKPGVNVSNSRASGATETDSKGSNMGKQDRMGCPFRKRNPIRFNIRDHETCAFGGFESIPFLKRHIQDFHSGRPPAWERSVYNRPQDPEDGITSFTIFEALSMSSDDSASKSWRDIWQLLFPDDMCVPASEYEPPVEIDEAEALFYNSKTLRRLFHGLSLVGHDEASIVEYMRQHITEVFDQCRAHQSH